MRRCIHVLTALTLGVASAGAQDILVRDFAEISYANGASPKVRRGMTSHVTIIKDFIDLVSFSNVSPSNASGLQISNISNGRINGTGFIAMDFTVPAGTNVGSTVFINVGSQDHFAFKVMHRGLVSSITANPQPSTIQVGTTWKATVSGTDLGGAVPDLAGASCHTTDSLTQNANVVTFTLTRAATCATNTFVLRVKPSATNDPPKYLTSSGQIPALGFSYIPPPPSGVACTSNPSIGKPVIRSHSDGQVVVFGSGTASPRNIIIRWDSITVGGGAAPNNEWLVSYTPGNTAGGGLVPGTNGKSTTSTVRGLSKSLPFVIPGLHTISIRAKNCGANAPTTSLSFRTSY